MMTATTSYLDVSVGLLLCRSLRLELVKLAPYGVAFVENPGLLGSEFRVYGSGRVLAVIAARLAAHNGELEARSADREARRAREQAEIDRRYRWLPRCLRPLAA